jgi:hypothetical protein
MINASLNLKFAPLLMTLGPIATLVIEEAENSWMVMLAMATVGGGKL